MSSPAAVVVKSSAPLLRLPVPVVLLKLIKFWDTWNGRDKTCRAVQYFTKFLAFHYQEKQKQTGTDYKVLVGQFKGLSSNLSLARKAFRLFRWINFYEKISKQLAEAPNTKSAKETLLYFLDFMSSVCMAVYLAYDGYIFGGKAKFILDKNLDKIGKTANYWWFWSLFASFIGDLIRLNDGYAKLASLSKKLKDINKDDDKEKEQAKAEVEKHKNETMHKLRITFAKTACDLLVPLSINEHADWVPNSGQCGLLGTASSLLGAYLAWPKN
jgi:peroxin-11B